MDLFLKAPFHGESKSDQSMLYHTCESCNPIFFLAVIVSSHGYVALHQNDHMQFDVQILNLGRKNWFLIWTLQILRFPGDSIVNVKQQFYIILQSNCKASLQR